MDRVTEVHPGADGYVRNVTIRTASSTGVGAESPKAQSIRDSNKLNVTTLTIHKFQSVRDHAH